ncbi:hypothetical protein ILUMI_09813, partial [Ignelater luminosus]
EMEAAAKKETEFAIENGNVDKNGVPCITVVADGCWSKRSYRTNYNALSGAGAIVRKQFGEILYNEHVENLIPSIQSSKDFFKNLQTIIFSVSKQARSLIYDLDSNIVEQYHSVVAKFVGGKRINYSKSNSYKY